MEKKKQKIEMFTFVVSSGDPIDISVPSGPALNHDGRLSVWHFLGTQEQAEELRTFIENNKCDVELYSPQDLKKDLKESGFGKMIPD